MENMCASCPNRAMANLNRSLGNEQEASRIESLGCQWWWGIEYTNTETKVKKTVYDCGIPHVARIVMDQGALVEEAAQSIQSTRNEIAKGFENVVETIVSYRPPAPFLMSLPHVLESGLLQDCQAIDHDSNRQESALNPVR